MDYWLWQSCGDPYQLEKIKDPNDFTTTYTVTFASAEDATVMKLKDIPQNLSKYLTIL